MARRGSDPPPAEGEDPGGSIEVRIESDGRVRIPCNPFVKGRSYKCGQIACKNERGAGPWTGKLKLEDPTMKIADHFRLLHRARDEMIYISCACGANFNYKGEKTRAKNHFLSCERAGQTCMDFKDFIEPPIVFSSSTLNDGGQLIVDYPGFPSACPLEICKWTTRATRNHVVTSLETHLANYHKIRPVRGNFRWKCVKCGQIAEGSKMRSHKCPEQSPPVAQTNLIRPARLSLALSRINSPRPSISPSIISPRITRSSIIRPARLSNIPIHTSPSNSPRMSNKVSLSPAPILSPVPIILDENPRIDLNLTGDTLDSLIDSRHHIIESLLGRNANASGVISGSEAEEPSASAHLIEETGSSQAISSFVASEPLGSYPVAPPERPGTFVGEVGHLGLGQTDHSIDLFKLQVVSSTREESYLGQAPQVVSNSQDLFASGYQDLEVNEVREVASLAQLTEENRTIPSNLVLDSPLLRYQGASGELPHGILATQLAQIKSQGIQQV